MLANPLVIGAEVRPRTADACLLNGPIPGPGLHGLVICAMPLQAEGAAAHRCMLEEIFGGQGQALLFHDCGAPEGNGGGRAMAQLLGMAIDAVGDHQDLRRLPLGLLGLGPASGAVLQAAAARRGRLQAVAACGGRLQAGLAALPLLRLPTLLVVGGADAETLAALDRAALRRLPGAWRLETVPGAHGCFSEPGCFETAAHHAASWFGLHLGLHVGRH